MKGPDLFAEQAPWRLRPLAGLYGLAVRMRLGAYRSALKSPRSLTASVVSVGNLVVGGTGKTPAVVMIARMLAESGALPAVVSRGYRGGSEEAVNVVSDGEEVLMGPGEAGDEPVLMARLLPGVPVLTGRNRRLVGQEAADRFGARTVILDDGFQHLALIRDVNLLLLDADSPFSNGRLVPAGPLREPAEEAVRATAFLLTRASSSEPPQAERIRRLFPGRPVFAARHQPTALVDPDGGRVPAEAVAGRTVVAFCGLARPDAFARTLTDLGAEIAVMIKWPDHHAPTPEDLQLIEQKAAETGADMAVTTAKDAVKLPRRLEVATRVVEIEMELWDREDEFRALLAAAAMK